MYTTVISASEAASLVGSDNVLMFDCSFELTDPDEGAALFRQGHVPGAFYLHLDDDLSSPPTGNNGRHPLPDREVLVARLRACGLRNDHQVIAYDNAGGAYAARLWWLLRWLGHEAVAVFDGGLAAWREAGLPFETGNVEANARGDFEGARSLNAPTIEAGAVLDNIQSRAFLVVDARAAPRFAGASNEMDPVPGHIPGAANRPFADNLEPDGRFKAADVLAGEFAAVLNGRGGGEVILQCGSGVTACHNALAMEMAGMSGARLYPGSWSEWIADPTRPVAVGTD